MLRSVLRHGTEFTIGGGNWGSELGSVCKSTENAGATLTNYSGERGEAREEACLAPFVARGRWKGKIDRNSVRICTLTPNAP